MNTAQKYSLILKGLKKEYRRVAIKLRRTEWTKRSCEDAGYLQYYPHILDNLSEFKEVRQAVKKDIRIYSKLLKEELKDAG
jgi:hypothetical protein